MRKNFLFILITLVLGVTAADSKAQSREQVYAGLVLHVMKYVEWPNYPDGSMTVGIVNDPQLVSQLNALSKGRKIHFRDVSVQKLKDASMIDKVDVLFVPARSSEYLSKVKSKAATQKILVIAETKGTEKSGVAISFSENKGKLEMRIYENEIKRVGFKVSEQLKRVAKVVL